MSIHKSLIPPSKLKRHRNVLTRDERLEILLKDGRWTDEKGVFGLPKVRSIMRKAKPKVKKEAAAAGAAPAEGAAAPAAAGAKGTAPAAGKGAAPAAGAKGAAPAAGAKGAAPAAKPAAPAKK
jgi:small basic protein (TIGR04137 family)